MVVSPTGNALMIIPVAFWSFSNDNDSGHDTTIILESNSRKRGLQTNMYCPIAYNYIS